MLTLLKKRVKKSISILLEIELATLRNPISIAPYSTIALSNPGTQHMSLSAGTIAQEPVSRMIPRLTAETFCFAPAQALASPSTVRWSSAVDSTIELACTGVAHNLPLGPYQDFF